MKIVEINSVCRGSTGTVMLGIADTVRINHSEVYTFSRKKPENIPKNHMHFGCYAENLMHRGIAYLTGISGKGSIIGTYNFLKTIDSIQPDVIHLHNLHGWFVNLPMLFYYIKKHEIPVVWTLHDCWSFTAQCSHFTMEKCDKWKTGCFDCPRYRLYPGTWVDRTGRMWKLKKKWLTGVDNLTIVTPSEWLANLVRQSFLRDYPVKVINNGINLSVFRPTQSNFREKNGLLGKKIILGVASGWTERKGLDVFVELSGQLNSNLYQIVLVGTDNAVDKNIPQSIFSIHRTQNQKELAEIYTAADVFVNPTREDNFPTVIMEALACGTPVVTFNTGGCSEMIDEKTGISVACDDIIGMKNAILNICEGGDFSANSCTTHAAQYAMHDKFSEYYELFLSILNG